VEKQIPEQAKALGLTEKEVCISRSYSVCLFAIFADRTQVIKNVMLKGTVDGEFTTVNDVAEATLFFAAHNTSAMTGQSLIVSHGWHME
jgi:3-hydroxybutyrate dehydrogenase